MDIKNLRLEDIVPYKRNAKKHDKRQIDNVAESIRQYGFVQPIVVDTGGVIVIGHCRALAAKQLGMETVPCVCVDDLTSEQVKALRLVDNKTNESEWDMDLLGAELSGLDLDGFDLDWGIKTTEEASENPYTTIAKIPQYQIRGEVPEIFDMYDDEKQNELIEEIEKSSVSDKEKQFLTEAAHRHCRWHYSAIAEYYAHAGKEMQELMEKSALVIIDYNDAVANGYVELSRKIKEIEDAG